MFFDEYFLRDKDAYAVLHRFIAGFYVSLKWKMFKITSPINLQYGLFFTPFTKFYARWNTAALVINITKPFEIEIAVKRKL